MLESAKKVPPSLADVKLPPIILASTSPRRSELLSQLGVEFKVVTNQADERGEKHFTAAELCRVNAFRKARAVAGRFPETLVLGADTLVHLGSTVFGKPVDLEDAVRMLKALQGKQHAVVTGVCLLQLRHWRQVIISESTNVKFRALDDEQIRAYLARTSPLDKAGAYAIQEHGDDIIESISGSYTNVMGLPLERLREELVRWESR